MEERQLEVGSLVISYSLRYSGRKTLGILVSPSGLVIVTAPDGATMDKIEAKLGKRAMWILKQQHRFAGYQPLAPARRYLSGETHLYLGRQLRLHVVDSGRNAVKYAGGQLVVHCRDRKQVEALVKGWMRMRAKQVYAELAAPWIVRFSQLGVSPAGVYVQEMERRWGSCTRGGKIILNLRLIAAPKACIVYVIVHELCHLIHPGHGSAFWELLSREMPDWEKWRRRLERV